MAKKRYYAVKIGGKNRYFASKEEAEAALRGGFDRMRPPVPKPAPKPDRIDTPDGKRYGTCSVCGKMAWLYECFYCHEEDMCWDCLKQHHVDDHNIFG